MTRSLHRLAALGLAALGSCGVGTAGAVAAADGDSGATGADAATIGSDLRVTDPSDPLAPPTSSPAAIRFRLTDAEGDAATVKIFFSRLFTGGEVPISTGATSGPLKNLGPGDHVVLWDWEQDLGVDGFVGDVTIRVEVVGGVSPDPLIEIALGTDLRFDLNELIRFAAELRVLHQVAPGFFLEERAPRSGMTLDVDQDGKIDLVTVDQSANELEVFTQIGTGQFARTSVSLSFVSTNVLDVAVADLDGDGTQDLIVTNQDSGEIALFYGTLLGTYITGPVIDTGESPTSVVAADLDGDDDIDLANVDEGGSILVFHVQTSPGTFELADVLQIGSSASSLAAGDLDGDGDIDLVTANPTSDVLTLVIQGQDGLFALGPTLDVSSGDTNPLVGPRSVVVADLDGDGLLDIVAARN